MKTYLITIDTGTTNARAALWNMQGGCAGIVKSGVGVRNTAIDGNNEKLKSAVKHCIESLMTQNGIEPDQVKSVYASGMITSNVGLVEIPHLIAPAGAEDFYAGVTVVEMPDICSMPIHFIPGLKNLDGAIDQTNVESMDIMRGEETEAIALLSWLPAGKEYLLVLPGSHTKFIAVDEAGRMTGCLTSIAGELLSCLTEHSILADSVGRRYVDGDYRKEPLLAGFRTARDTSFGRAAFSTRIMNQFVTKDYVDCANFLLGAVLQGDVASVKSSKALQASRQTSVVVAGKEPLRSALVDVFATDGFFADVQAFIPPDDIILSGYGAFIVAKNHEKW